MLATACGGRLPAPAAPSYAESVGLAKCSVAASHTSPIITEWSAEEKARLAAARARGAVVVAFSGCELRVLDGCHPGGAYAFERTTTSHERIDIRDEEELYAKMPESAARLDADLKHAGSMSVGTTIVGQHRLEQPVQLPRDPACAGATHVVSAISVGAYETSLGARVEGRASATIANVPVAANGEAQSDGRHAEGNAEACLQTAEDAPRDDCDAPIQLFLDPIGGNAKSQNDRWARAPDSWNVAFRAPEQRWTLYDATDHPLCALPCTRNVTDNSGLTLRRDDGADRVAVPDDLGLASGSSVDAEVLPRRGNVVLAVVPTMVTGTTTLVTGVIGISCIAGVKDPSGNTPPVCSSAALPVTFGVSTALLAASIYWLLWSRGEPKLDVERATPSVLGGTF